MTLRARRWRKRIPSGRVSLQEVQVACEFFGCDLNGEPIEVERTETDRVEDGDDADQNEN